MTTASDGNRKKEPVKVDKYQGLTKELEKDWRVKASVVLCLRSKRNSCLV